MSLDLFTPPLPLVLLNGSESTRAVLVAHGAEGHLYRTTFGDAAQPRPCALKYRPPKAYRHRALDERLKRARILAEARVLARCRRQGVVVPALLAVHEAAGWLMMEWIAGAPVRTAINGWLAADAADDAPLRQLLRRIGQAVGALHQSGIVHGDLTTSNMMLRRPGPASPDDGDADLDGLVREGEVVLIDFGLASQSAQDEDRAVDLYVLERAFASTHPRAEHLLAEELTTAYASGLTGAAAVLRKLNDVRQRGRKRSMLG